MYFAYLGRFCIRIIWFFSGTLDAFGVQTKEKQNRKSECPMTPFNQSTQSQSRSPARANHSIATPEKQAAQFHPIRTTRSPLYHQEAYLLILHSTRQAENKEEKRSRRNHSIALDHKVTGPFNLDFTAFHSIARRSP